MKEVARYDYAQVVGRTVGGMLALFAPQAMKPPKRTDSRFQESAASVGTGERSWDSSLINPDPVVLAKTLGVYDEMRRDDALGAYLEMKKAARLATAWRVDPADDSRQAQEQADFITHVLVRMRGSMKDCLQQIMSALDYGYSVTNKPLLYLEDGPYTGKVGYKCLKTKRPHDFSFDTDEFYNIKPDGLLHYPEAATDAKRLQVNEFIVYSYRMEFGNWYGRSDCMRAYRAWNSKRWVLRFWDSWLERFAGGFLDITFRPGEGTTQDYETAQKMITQHQSRTGYLHPDVFETQLVESSGVGGRSYNERVQACDISMARTVLLPDLLGFSGKPTGSYALGKKHFDVFLWVLESLGEDLCETVVGEQIIRPLIDLNYGKQEAYPEFVFEPLSQEQKFAIAAQVLTAIEKGGITPDLEVENFLRGLFNLAEKEEQEEKRAGGSAIRSPAQQPPEEEEPEPGGGTGSTPGQPGQPGGQAAGPEAGGGKGQVATQMQDSVGPAKLRRQLTTYEEKVDFDAVISVTNNSHGQLLDTWSGLFKAQKTAMLNWVRRNKIIANSDAVAVGKMKLPRVMDLQKSLQRYLLVGFYHGALQAQREATPPAQLAESGIYTMPGAQAFADLDLRTIPLDEVEKFFLSKGLVTGSWVKQSPAHIKRLAVWITGVAQDSILAQARMVLYKGIHKQDQLWAEAELAKLFDGYLQTGQLKEGALGTAHRIETIARTNFTTAFNEGRRRKFEDPQVADYVEAYQWSSVLDGATTPYCEAMDGRIIRKTELAGIWPPAHYNCRSMVVPVVEGEQYELKPPVSPQGRGDGFEEGCSCAHAYGPWLLITQGG